MRLFTTIIVFLIYFTICEYKPKKQEIFKIENHQTRVLNPNLLYTITTWNTGYASLVEETNFFADGGEMSLGKNIQIVKIHLKNITEILIQKESNFFNLQEFDKSFKRSFL